MRLWQSKKTTLNRDLHRVSSIAGAQLADHVLHMGFHCLFSDGKVVANEPVRIARGNEAQDLDLTVRQVVGIETLCQAVCYFWWYAPETFVDFPNRPDKFRTK